MSQQLTAIIERKVDGYLAFCPQLDIASEGDSIETAGQNFCVKRWSRFFATASKSEMYIEVA